MLKVKSFKMSEASEINELLNTHGIYKEASMLMSNGEIIVPYEDGLGPNVEQKINKIKALKYADQSKVEGFLHDQKVLSIQEKGVQKEIEEIEAKMVTAGGKKEDYENNKEYKEVLKRLENVLNQTQNAIIMNQSEVTRLMTEIFVYDEEIAVLEGNEIKEN